MSTPTKYRNVKRVEELRRQIDERKEADNDNSQALCVIFCCTDSRSKQELKIAKLEKELARELAKPLSPNDANHREVEKPVATTAAAADVPATTTTTTQHHISTAADVPATADIDVPLAAPNAPTTTTTLAPTATPATTAVI